MGNLWDDEEFRAAAVLYFLGTIALMAICLSVTGYLLFSLK